MRYLSFGSRSDFLGFLLSFLLFQLFHKARASSQSAGLQRKLSVLFPPLLFRCFSEQVSLESICQYCARCDSFLLQKDQLFHVSEICLSSDTALGFQKFEEGTEILFYFIVDSTTDDFWIMVRFQSFE
ncbi:hypothetical protein RvY_19232 [Ramazzottius varieornatus]|uniref:Uncharacterized protein n=1 Tax=Ramazzottius varieornatus TaxID=947166 RepID=A0A1D1WBR3_RAMVA|nr:hypothetical protein RvY_19232 [Ramazzottius varieornatus]